MAKERKKFTGFDADALAEERGKADIKIGGKIFHARKKTGDVIKGVILSSPEDIDPEFMVGPDGEPIKDGDGNPIPKARPRAEQAENIDLVYQQVAQIVQEADFTGEHTQAKLDKRALFLAAHLDITDARELMQQLMPSDDDEDDSGN